MTINERIKFAEEQREESFSNGSLYDLSYWVGYIDALKVIVEEETNETRQSQLPTLALLYGNALREVWRDV